MNVVSKTSREINKESLEKSLYAYLDALAESGRWMDPSIYDDFQSFIRYMLNQIYGFPSDHNLKDVLLNKIFANYHIPYFIISAIGDSHDGFSKLKYYKIMKV